MLTNSQLKLILLSSNLVKYDTLEKMLEEAEQKKLLLSDLLVKTGLVAPEKIGRIIADAMKYSFASLKDESIDEAMLTQIPEVVAKNKGVVAFGQTAEGIKIGMTNPEDKEMVRILRKKFGRPLLIYYITKQDLAMAVTKYRGSIQKEVTTLLERLADQMITPEDKDQATIKMIDLIFQYGFQSKASDVHIEPYETKVVVRFRIDGTLYDIMEITKPLLDLLLVRIKILSKMRTDEHRAAQDGKFRFEIDDETVDARVSILPITCGEKVVVRLLSSRSRQYELTDLGIDRENFKKVDAAMNNPHGMILVTGPTGSGKTTTVYGILKILNKREVNISSIEDPVEYAVEGVNQIQVNAKTNLTFANGLRAILRQDPDIIMIGEIRDEETAQIAVNSAMTGHLVLSTLHTNDAATTLPRLLDMGIEPFLVASTVNIIIAQRLVRQICPKCRVSHIPTPEDWRMLRTSPKFIKTLKDEYGSVLSRMRFYKGAGCKACAKTGYKGRVAVLEVLEMTDSVRKMVVNKRTSEAIVRVAKRQGMRTMLQDGAYKCLKGQTTYHEVMRVIGV